MSILILTIASVAAACSPQSQTPAEPFAKSSAPTVRQPPIFSNQQEVFETGLLKMDGYERYLKEPKMTLKITRYA